MFSSEPDLNEHNYTIGLLNCLSVPPISLKTLQKWSGTLIIAFCLDFWIRLLNNAIDLLTRIYNHQWASLYNSSKVSFTGSSAWWSWIIMNSSIWIYGFKIRFILLVTGTILPPSLLSCAIQWKIIFFPQRLLNMGIKLNYLLAILRYLIRCLNIAKKCSLAKRLTLNNACAREISWEKENEMLICVTYVWYFLQAWKEGSLNQIGPAV